MLTQDLRLFVVVNVNEYTLLLRQSNTTTATIELVSQNMFVCHGKRIGRIIMCDVLEVEWSASLSYVIA